MDVRSPLLLCYSWLNVFRNFEDFGMDLEQFQVRPLFL